MDTIVAVSSGRPPAAIAVVRVSGPLALAVAELLAGTLPAPRVASLRALRDGAGGLLDRALILVFPGPHSATGEDLVELHCHGGRAVVAAVTGAALRAGAREAEPGEFTRRALLNGRIDLAQAEGLADLLEAETEAQRRAALTASEGRVSKVVHSWLARLADLAAHLEATLDYAEEGDVDEAVQLDLLRVDALVLQGEILDVLEAPPVERIRDGLRVVIGGPPNAGKSTLLNLMSEREAAIVSPHAGTTRDRVEAPVRRGDFAYLLTDTAGLTKTANPVEAIGVARAEDAIAGADVLIWLADAPPPRPDAVWVHARADLPARTAMPAGPALAVARSDLSTVSALWELVDQRARTLLPHTDDLPLKARQRAACAAAAKVLSLDPDPLIAGEHLRTATRALGSVLGLDATEQTLDALFSRFCLGK